MVEVIKNKLILEPGDITHYRTKFLNEINPGNRNVLAKYVTKELEETLQKQKMEIHEVYDWILNKYVYKYTTTKSVGKHYWRALLEYICECNGVDFNDPEDITVIQYNMETGITSITGNTNLFKRSEKDAT